jgi:hypothetical protein
MALVARLGSLGLRSRCALTRSTTVVRQGLTLAHFTAQLQDLRERIAHDRAQLQHPLATSTG